MHFNFVVLIFVTRIDYENIFTIENFQIYGTATTYHVRAQHCCNNYCFIIYMYTQIIGPVRHFMELVVTGLSKNPRYTASEKRQCVQWYKDYFSEFTSKELQSL